MSAAPCRWPCHGKRRCQGGSAGKGGLGSLIVVMMSLLLQHRHQQSLLLFFQ